MVTMHLCKSCVPEGSVLLPQVTTGKPTHCYGKNDHVRDGILGGYQCSCECNNIQYLIAKAEGRYLNDVEFYNLVNKAVALAVPKTINESVNNALNEAALSAASLALIFKEMQDGSVERD